MKFPSKIYRQLPLFRAYAEGNPASQRADKYPLEALSFLIDKQAIGGKWICCREYCKVSRQLLVLTGKFGNRSSQQCVFRAARRQLVDRYTVLQLNSFYNTL